MKSPFASIAMARYLPAFLAVARHGSFTKAARELHMSQPAVTLAVHQLETLLGVRLFDRNTHGVQLTRTGQEFVPTGERLIAELDEAMHKLSAPAGPERAELRIAAVHSLALKVLPQAIARFVADGADEDVVLHDYSSAEICRRVKWNEADIGFASAPRAEPDLALEPVLSDRIGVLAHIDHDLIRRPEPVRWTDLSSYDFLRLRGDFIDDIIAQVPNAPPNVRNTDYEASYNAVLWAQLGEGSKVGVVPALFAPDPRVTHLAFRPLHEPEAWRKVFAVTAKGRPVREAARRLVSRVREVVDVLATSDRTIQRLSL